MTLKNLAQPRTSDLTPCAILEAVATVQIVDVRLSTADGRHFVLPRHTRPNKEHEFLLHQIGMTLPQQPAPRISARAPQHAEGDLRFQGARPAKTSRSGDTVCRLEPAFRMSRAPERRAVP